MQIITKSATRHTPVCSKFRQYVRRWINTYKYGHDGTATTAAYITVVVHVVAAHQRRIGHCIRAELSCTKILVGLV